MQVGRRGLSGARKESTFALYAKQSFTILPDALVGVLVARQVGRNGWAVMAALCHAIFSDGRIGVMSSNEVCARTGLTKYQVARGMTELRDKGIIAPVIRTNAEGYRHPDRSNYGHVAHYCICRDIWALVELKGTGDPPLG